MSRNYFPLKIKDRAAWKSNAWHPRQKWTVIEAHEIMETVGYYKKSLTKAIIALGWKR